MKKISLSTLLTGLLLLVCACGKGRAQEPYIPPQPDYSNSVFWYGSHSNAHNIDVFYIYPTIGTKPTDPEGNRIYYTDVYRAEEREAASKNQKYIRDIYADKSFNLYAPFYRQMTIEFFERGVQSYTKGMELSLEDVAAAFDHYIKYLNNGRPFILMGHSQGSMLIVELLKKHISAKDLNRMVAAVVMGWRITSEELTTYADKIRPATSKDDLGVVVNFNSLTDLNACSPLLDHSVVCINPINWKTDGTTATRKEHKGAYRFDKQSGTYKLTPELTGGYVKDGYMICTDIDPMQCYVESMKHLFPLGCLHMMETWMYSANIKENLILRADKFIKAKGIHQSSNGK